LLSNLQLAGVVDESLEQILSGRSDRWWGAKVNSIRRVATDFWHLLVSLWWWFFRFL